MVYSVRIQRKDESETINFVNSIVYVKDNVSQCGNFSQWQKLSLWINPKPIDSFDDLTHLMTRYKVNQCVWFSSLTTDLTTVVLE